MTRRRVVSSIVALFRRRRIERELDDEIRAHIELAEHEARAAGLSPAEARRAALRRFGGIAQMKEDHRDQRGFAALETLVRDIRHGFSSLLRYPSFALTAIGVLTLGIGANTAMFSLLDAVLLKPLPFPEADRIIRVWEAPSPTTINATTTLDFLQWQRRNTVFSALSAERGVSVALTGRGDALRLNGTGVSASYFDVFGVRAQLGRTFVPADDKPGAEPVVVLSDAAWHTYFGADRAILNSHIQLDGQPHAVVGILAPCAFDRGSAAFWRPLHYAPDQMNAAFHWLVTVGRLAPGVTLEQALQQMKAIDASISDLSPEWKGEWSVTVEPYDRRMVGDTLRQSLYIAFGAVILVLLIACANLANLLTTRGAARQKEMAVRAALGAGRARLAAQLFTETLVLCVIGAATGTLFAQALLRLAQPILRDALPYTAEVTLDLRVLAFTAATALLVAILAGLVPSIRASFAHLAPALNQSARGSSTSRELLRRTIVITEVGFSLVLVCGAVLLFRSLWNLQEIDLGFRVDNTITMSVDLPTDAYRTPESATQFYRAAIERLASIPGVEHASLSTDLPLQGIRQGEGVSMTGSDEGVGASYKRIDHNYLSTLQIPVLEGRGFAERDRAGAPRVMLVNRRLRDRLKELFHLDNPVGLAFNISTPNYMNSKGTSLPVELIGVVGDERIGALTANNPNVVYVPLAQVPRTELKLILHTSAEPASVIPEVRQVLRRIDANLPLGDIRTMEDIHGTSLAGTRRPAWVIGAFAITAAILAAIGLYGVLSHTVAAQRREIGIRIALGASSTNVVAHVVRGAIAMIAVGLALGLVGVFGLTRLLESLLYQVSALDPLALASAAVTMLAIGLVAAFVPARRAAAVDPVTALRDEG